MKISFLIPAIRQGGAERQFILLARNLIKEGYSVNFITYKDNECFYNIFDIGHKHIPKSWMIDIKFLRSLTKYVRENKIDILFSCYQGIFEGPLLWARLVKLIYPNVTVITGYRNSYFSKSSILIEKLTQHMSSSFITNNFEAANFLLYKMKINKRKIFNIRNIADLETFFPLKKEEINKKRSFLWGDQNQRLFIFGIFGSYKWTKNHDIVIEAIRLLRGKNLLSNISIECFGDKECNGSLYYKLKHKINNYGLEEFIHLNDSVNNMNDYLNCIDAIILPSIYEGYSNIVMEGLLCNKPIIISVAANKSKFVIDNKHGFIFEEDDPGSLAEKIKRLKAFKFQIDEITRRKFINEHNINVITEKYMDVFQSCISKRLMDSNK